MVLYCSACGAGASADGGLLRPVCAVCGRVPLWYSDRRRARRERVWWLTPGDRRLLRSLHISPDD